MGAMFFKNILVYYSYPKFYTQQHDLRASLESGLAFSYLVSNCKRKVTYNNIIVYICVIQTVNKIAYNTNNIA
ncbi:MAG: hypothetical protein BWY14_01256 [Parcubacteria group bacterium ADurb.Bin192]|nr:MAG: hypothetical protein BWY14_01256 [Parcubacteria group bacterium ADurb.Bin192]